MAHGAELKLKGQYADAEKEFHQALSLAGPNADIYLALAMVQGKQKEWDDEAATAREVLKMNPNSEKAHILIGMAFGGKGDWDGAEAEDREVLKSNTKSDVRARLPGRRSGRQARLDWRNHGRTRSAQIESQQ